MPASFFRFIHPWYDAAVGCNPRAGNMTLRELAKRAAGRANAAAMEVIGAYAAGAYPREEDITAALISLIGHNFANRHFAQFRWSAHVLNRGRGVANEEGTVGADMLIHVALETPTVRYSKGVLIQAKKKGKGVALTKPEHDGLVGQCEDMLAVTPCAYVVNYTTQAMRFTSAHVVQASPERVLSNLTVWKSHRFFLELFRSPIGDPKIISAKYRDLPGVSITGKGEIDEPEGDEDTED